MKAAVLHNFGDIPRFEEFPDPVAGDGEVIVTVRAVALDYAVKIIASGAFFASKQFYPGFPAVVGHGGVGTLEDGTLVTFRGTRPPFGAFAEKVAVPKSFVAPVPEGIGAEQAAVIPSAALSALMPLRHAARLLPGETVLVNGATSVSGMLAVRIAKHLGAGRVVGTGRSLLSGKRIMEQGADAFIALDQSDEQVMSALAKEAPDGYDVVLDYLWGHPAEMIFRSFVPAQLGFARKRTRFVQIGELAGPEVRLRADSVRTSGLEIIGFGSQNTPDTLQAMAQGSRDVWDMIRHDVLSVETARYALEEVGTVWGRQEHGRRIVLV